MGWNEADLRRELAAYRDCLESRPLTPKTVESHSSYANRFVNWLYGVYHARGSQPRPDPVSPVSRVSSDELRVEIDRYVRYLLDAGRARGGVPAYRYGALLFLHWLETGDCEGS
jgi:hypothetical protein